jgi:hypothetical protein
VELARKNKELNRIIVILALLCSCKDNCSGKKAYALERETGRGIVITCNMFITTNIAAGRAIAQAVSRWLPTAAARVRPRVWSSGICGGQSCAGAGFLRVLWFPLPIFIPPIAPQSPSPIICGWYNRPKVAAVQGT